jgi:four helix bundle protein
VPSQSSSRGYRRLIAWQKAQDLASLVDRVIGRRRLRLWLIDQVMKSAGSVHANIAEGYTRGTLKDYLHFLDMARASLAELESHLYFMANNGYIDEGDYAEVDQAALEVGNILVGLMRALNAKLAEGTWKRLEEERPPYHEGNELDFLLPPSSFLLPPGGEA